MNAKAVLVTGANGFLGRAILSQLLKMRFSTRATDLGCASATAGIAYQKSDITRPEGLMDAIGGAATVIHAAGLAHIFSPGAGSDENFQQINEIGTENVAKVASQAGVEHLILISSVSVYGPYTTGIYDENTPCNPAGPYAADFDAQRQPGRSSG